MMQAGCQLFKDDAIAVTMMISMTMTEEGGGGVTATVIDTCCCIPIKVRESSRGVLDTE